MNPISTAKAPQKSHRKPFAMLAMLLLLLVNGAYSSESYVVHGSVSNLPHGGFPITHITATCMTEGDVVGTATTDENGQYTLSFGFVGVANWESHSHALRVYPNPYGRQTTLQAVLPQADHYTLEVSDISGKILMQQKMFLEAGQQQIRLQDQWGEGMRIFHLFSSHYSSRAKGMQSSAAQASGSFEVFNTKNNVKAQSGRPIQLSFESENHYTYDTIIDFADLYELELDVSLQQQSQSMEAQFAISLSNLPMEVAVQGAQIQLSDANGQPLTQGESLPDGQWQGSYTQQYWAWEQDTLFAVEQLQVHITAAHHEQKEWLMDYRHSIDTLAVLQQQKQWQQSTLIVEVSNNPMQMPVANAMLTITNEHEEVLAQPTTNAQGMIEQSIERGFYAHNSDTLADFESLEIIISKPHHTSLALAAPYSAHVSLSPVLQQIKYEDIAVLDVSLLSEPLMFEPDNVTVQLFNTNTDDMIMQSETTQGQLSFEIPYDYYLYDDFVSYYVDEAWISEIEIRCLEPGHEEAVFAKDFGQSMAVDQSLYQLPAQGSTPVSVSVQNDIFAYFIEGASIILKNAQNNETLASGQTNADGQYETVIAYQYWEYQDLYMSELNTIALEVTQDHHQSHSSEFSNEAQNLDITLEQIPQEKTADIFGYIKSEDEPLEGASMELRSQENTLYTLTTDTQGMFETQLDYLLYINHNNPAEQLTQPENIYGIASKDGYLEETTTTRMLEEEIDFGVINLALEPVEKTLHFTFKPITVDGDPQVPENVIFVRLGDVTESFTLGSQTEIEVNISAITHDTHVTLWDTPPVNQDNEPLYNETIIIHTQNREWHQPPIKNNNQTVWRTEADEAFDTLRVEIDALHNRHDLELIKMYNSFDHPDPTIGRIYTNGVKSANFITGRSGYQIGSHAPTAEGAGWQILFKTYDEAVPENTVSQTFIDNWTNAINQVMDASTRNDGQKTFDWSEIYFVDSPDDPVLLAAQENNWINTLTIEPNSNYSMATNAVSTGYPNHMFGRARTPPAQTSIRVALEETLEPTYRFTDPDLSSVAYIIEGPPENPNLNDFAKRAIRYRQQLSHATRFDNVVEE